MHRRHCGMYSSLCGIALITCFSAFQDFEIALNDLLGAQHVSIIVTSRLDRLDLGMHVPILHISSLSLNSAMNLIAKICPKTAFAEGEKQQLANVCECNAFLVGTISSFISRGRCTVKVGLR